MMYGWGAGWGVGTWLVTGFGMLLFWAIVVILAIVAVRRIRTGPAPSTPVAPHATALDILAERFARGEIDEKEFSSRRRALLERPE